ncbi:VOC family protein [Umezawaea sp. Da 62-37]|uniref:VOC family protein n=1 Tax=Umezawaea sp. Da 62-37 TaxID=3075927 RepID=UPI0028F6DA20|nr:VOC family protein [Umezawaea sp. Da 62-37]WNV86631.1 VOC family protein [Umezawaea sp. Da 62-37]
MLQANPARGLRRIELTTDAPEATADFYAQLLGWSVLAEPDDVFGGWVGDRLAVHISPGHDGWRLVFGGTPARPLHHGAAADRGRVLHGPWAPEPRSGEPCWVELSADADADDHYATELNWQIRDADSATLYEAELDTSRRPVAGRREIGNDLPPGWLVYFSVPDVTAAAATAVELGGSIVIEPHNTPTGLAAAIAAPAGGVVGILQAPSGWGGALATTTTAGSAESMP